MAIFRNLRACPVAPADGTGVRLRFESSKYFNIFLPAPWNAKPIPLGWSKSSLPPRGVGPTGRRLDLAQNLSFSDSLLVECCLVILYPVRDMCFYGMDVH